MAGNKENKVKYNIKNVHVAKQTETAGEEGATTYTYATPKNIPGAVSISLDAEGEISTFYADGMRIITPIPLPCSLSLTAIRGQSAGASITVPVPGRPLSLRPRRRRWSLAQKHSPSRTAHGQMDW